MLILIFLVGLSMVLYPSVSNYYNSLHQTRYIAAYEEQVQNISDVQKQELRDQASQYNQTLVGRKNVRFTLKEEELETYSSLLNPEDTGVMGFLDIPKLHLRLSVYHGISSEVLRTGVGHIPGSSLPVGGEGSHCVLSGHRGLPSARLFTDLDQLKPGDIFYLHVLGEVLAYEVDQLRVVEPGDLSELAITPGKDYCTLVTCTPYGINTDRLLVRGVRTVYRPAVRVEAEAAILDSMYVLPVIAVPVFIVLLVLLLVKYKKR